MKAIVHDRYGPPVEVLHLEEVERPAVGDDDVLVRVLFNLGGLPYPGVHDNLLIAVGFVLNALIVGYSWSW